MSARLRRLAAVALAVAIAIAGCDKKPTTAPTPPGGGSLGSSVVEAVFPAARAVRVPDSTPIWAQFKVDLDTSTVNTHNVFFKLDTRRLPITLAWEPATRRIRITSLERLSLRRTYTVELSAALKTASGQVLGTNVSWQFTTSSVRLPQLPQPIDGAVGESPFAALRWGGLTEVSAGTVRYEVHAAPDSAGAVNPSLPAIGTVATGLIIPPLAWTQDAPVYWAVHVLNQATGERLIGPAWRFQALPAGTPIDSVRIDFSDWSFVNASAPATRICQAESLLLNTTTVSVMRWRLALNDTTIRLAGAKIEFSPRAPLATVQPGPSVWYALADWTACTGVSYPGPPFTDETDGKLADAEVIGPKRLRFASDRLTAHIEATMRNGGLYGYIFRSPYRMGFWGASTGFGAGSAELKIYRYRLTPAPALARPAGRSRAVSARAR